MIALAAGWLLALAVMVVLTANPVVFNRWQLRQADLVVEADRQQVYAVWPIRGEAPDLATITFERPRQVFGRTLVPLRRTGTGYRVVTVRLEEDADAVPIVYPATDESRTDLEAAIEVARE